MSEHQTKPTPGPWMIEEGPKSDELFITKQKPSGGRGSRIARLWNGKSPYLREANARLIASAPDMATRIDQLTAERDALAERVRELDSLRQSAVDDCIGLTNRIAELEARNAELEGAALKTADGVLLTDGMEVWIPNANGVLGGPTEKRVLTTKRLLYSERDAYGRVGARLGCCYSTHQAAEAARGKGVG